METLMEFKVERTAKGSPMAVLYDGVKVVAKFYLSPDHKKFRIVLPELVQSDQVVVRTAEKIVDFTRVAA